MSRCLVFARSLWGICAAPGRWLRGFVFASASRCAVGLGEVNKELPVHSFVSGCCVARVAGGHLGQGRRTDSLILHGLLLSFIHNKVSRWSTQVITMEIWFKNIHSICNLKNIHLNQRSWRFCNFADIFSDWHSCRSFSGTDRSLFWLSLQW